MDIKRGAFQPLPQVTYSRPRYHLCTNLTLSALLASYISPTTHDSSYIGTIHQTKLVPRGRDPYVQRRGSLVTEALGTRLQWNQSQDCFSTHVTINYQFFFAHGKWVPITYFPIFDTIQYVFPRLWPFTQGVFPHLAPLDRLTGHMFSRAFYYCLTGYMSVFSRAFHHCLTGYLFSRTFHHCLIAYKLCAFRHPLSGCKFSRAFHRCLTGYMFSCAFHHGLSDYTFSNDFHHWLIGYKFTHAFHPCFTGCMFSRVFTNACTVPSLPALFSIAWQVTCFLAIFTSKWPLLDWLCVSALFTVTWPWLQDFPRLPSKPRFTKFKIVFPVFSYFKRLQRKLRNGKSPYLF